MKRKKLFIEPIIGFGSMTAVIAPVISSVAFQPKEETTKIDVKKSVNEVYIHPVSESLTLESKTIQEIRNVGHFTEDNVGYQKLIGIIHPFFTKLISDYDLAINFDEESKLPNTANVQEIMHQVNRILALRAWYDDLLDGLGMVPGVGPIADAIHAGIDIKTGKDPTKHTMTAILGAVTGGLSPIVGILNLDSDSSH